MNIKLPLFKINELVFLWIMAFYRNDFTFQRITTNTEIESLHLYFWSYSLTLKTILTEYVFCFPFVIASPNIYLCILYLSLHQMRAARRGFLKLLYINTSHKEE